MSSLKACLKWGSHKQRQQLLQNLKEQPLEPALTGNRSMMILALICLAIIYKLKLAYTKLV